MKSSKQAFIRAGLFAITGLVLSFLVYRTDIGSQLEEWARDLQLRYRKPSLPSDRVRIVGVTDRDLEELGGWPISRGAHADIVRILDTAGAATMVLDVLFTGPSHDPAADEVLKTVAEGVPKLVFAYSFEGISWGVGHQPDGRPHFLEGHLYGADLSKWGQSIPIHISTPDWADDADQLPG